MKTLLSAAALFATLCASTVTAQELEIGMANVVTSIDPHYYNATPNNNIWNEIFDSLTTLSPNGKVLPDLAVKWEPTGEKTWVFHLREGVTFHDGSPFTAKDVVFTLERAKHVPNSPGGFTGYIGMVKSARALDDLTVEITTDRVEPNLPGNLSSLAIVSKAVGEGATTNDYNSGKAAIGTGPFKFADFRHDEKVDLVRNDNYWGAAPEWEKVTYQMIPSPGARTAAVLSGDVDVIEQPNSQDLDRLRADENTEVVEANGLRIIYIFLNQDETNPGLTDASGNILDPNPLRDQRVRKALSISIDRELLADRLMRGTATPNAQWLPEGVFSYSPNIKLQKPDVEKAKALLAEAGYPNGFRAVLNVPADRYPNASSVAQGVAQMWTKIGVRTQVESFPWSTYSKDSYGFGLGILGWGNSTFDARSALMNVIGARNEETGFGTSARGNYNNPTLDALTLKALSTIDDTQREALLIEAVDMAMDDVAIIPLYNQKNMWVVRKGLSMPARQFERTLAHEVTSVK
ncbi:MAG: ABC transporter substrate-binding protein [Puniceicoccales bacterium]